MTSTDRIAQPWGTRTPYGPGADWPVRVDTYLQEGTTAADVDRWVQTASILHSNGDAMDIAVRDERIVAVRDRVEDRVNHGRLGPSAATGIDKRNIRRRQGEKPEQLVATDLREPTQALQLLLREHPDDASQLRGERGGTVARVRAGEALGDLIDDLPFDDLLEQPAHLGVPDGGADHDPQWPPVLGIVPGLRQGAEHPFGQGGGVAGQRAEQDRGWIRGQRECGPEQAFLRAEEVADQRGVHPGVRGDGAHRHGLVALREEPATRDVEDLGPRLRPPRPPSPGRTVRFIHHA